MFSAPPSDGVSQYDANTELAMKLIQKTPLPPMIASKEPSTPSDYTKPQTVAEYHKRVANLLGKLEGSNRLDLTAVEELSAATGTTLARSAYFGRRKGDFVGFANDIQLEYKAFLRNVKSVMQQGLALKNVVSNYEFYQFGRDVREMNYWDDQPKVRTGEPYPDPIRRLELESIVEWMDDALRSLTDSQLFLRRGVAASPSASGDAVKGEPGPEIDISKDPESWPLPEQTRVDNPRVHQSEEDDNATFGATANHTLNVEREGNKLEKVVDSSEARISVPATRKAGDVNPHSPSGYAATNSTKVLVDIAATVVPGSIARGAPPHDVIATPRSIRYDRTFLLQFMNSCKGELQTEIPLKVLGIDKSENGGGYRKDRQTRGSRRSAGKGLIPGGIGSLSIAPTAENHQEETDPLNGEEAHSCGGPVSSAKTAPRDPLSRELDAASADIIVNHLEILLDNLTSSNLAPVTDDILRWLHELARPRYCQRAAILLKLIFVKIKDGNRSSRAYAELCRHLCHVQYLQPKDRDDGLDFGVSFKRRLIARSAQEIEQASVYRSRAIAALRQESVSMHDRSDTPDGEGEKTLKSPRTTKKQNYAARRKRLALVSFVGELFNGDVVPLDIIRESILELVSALSSHIAKHDEEIIEWLCHWLKVVRAKLEQHPETAQDLQHYMQELLLADRSHLSHRVSSMVRDLFKSQQHWQRESLAEESSLTTGQSHAESTLYQLDFDAEFRLTHLRLEQPDSRREQGPYSILQEIVQ